MIPSIPYLLMTDELFRPVGCAALVKRWRRPRYSVARTFVCNVKQMPTAAAAAAVFRATRLRCTVTHILCFQSNFLLTANAHFLCPHQSVRAPRWVEGCYYCKQRPCCFWLSEACSDLGKSPDLCHLSISGEESNQFQIKIWFLIA